MPKPVSARPISIDRFFAGPGSRADQWRDLVETAEDWMNGSGSRAKFEAELGRNYADRRISRFSGFDVADQAA